MNNYKILRTNRGPAGDGRIGINIRIGRKADDVEVGKVITVTANDAAADMLVAEVTEQLDRHPLFTPNENYNG
jgi:ribosomal 50S subunit-recycling heat shock protein